MTIYILGTPQETAQSLDDKSLDRMIRDIAQVLCNVHGWKCGQRKHGDKITQDLKLYNTDMDKLPLPLNAENKYIYKWSQWARECVANYNYLVELGARCCVEYVNRTYIYGDEKIKCHKLQNVIEWAQDNVPDLPRHCHSCAICYNETQEGCDFCQQTTPFPLVMPKKYRPKNSYENGGHIFEKDIFESYINYYKSKLKPGATWTRREKPKFL